jgi:hypothetical protein
MSQLAPLCVCGVYLGMAVGALAIGWLVRNSRHEQLRLLARKLEDGRARVPRGLFSSMEEAGVEGRLGGLRVRLSFDVRGSGKHKQTWALYRVWVENGPGTVTVHEADVLTRFARWLGFGGQEVTGDAALDRRLSFRGDRAALRQLHRRESGQGPALARALQRALDEHGLARVELRRDRIEAEQRCPWDATRYERALHALVELGRLWGRQPVQITVRGGARAEPHLAWTAGGSQALCPYCRAGLEPGDDLQACPRCDTVHHAECLSEAGGCTVFGCAGRAERGPRQPTR